MKMGTKAVIDVKKLLVILGVILAVAIFGPVGLLVYATVATQTYLPALDALHNFSANLSAKGGLLTLAGVLIDPYGAGGIVGILVIVSVFAVIVYLLFAGLKGSMGSRK